jgi:HD-GYP domain-containing protein (c-di-GMP phosphodiesterase class II)
MGLISPRIKYLLLLLSSQIVCFAIGLWGHAQFVSSSVERAARERGWELLADPDDAIAQQSLVTAVDERWRVVSSGEGAAEGGGAFPPGATLEWRTADDPAAGASLLRGVIGSGATQQVALATPLATGYRILHVPISSIALPADQLTEGMQLAGAITLLWVAALLGLVGYLLLTSLYDRHARQQTQWEGQSLSQIQTLQRTRDAIVFGLAKLAEFRDQETGYHLERISAFATRLASALRRDPRYATEIDPEFVRMIGVSAVLHDIGKVGVPDAILLKPGPLTPSEGPR